MELSWQGIYFDVVISGNPSSSRTTSVTQDYKNPTDLKTIIYTNSKQQDMWTNTNAIESAQVQSPNSGKVMPMTGEDGLQFKDITMYTFMSITDDFDELEDDVGGTLSLLPNLKIMPATKAADCGMSSLLCGHSLSSWTCSLDVLLGPGDWPGR